MITDPSRAVCRAHPDEAVTFACERCGAFACERCRDEADRRPRCAACAARRPGPRETPFGPAVGAGLRLVRRSLPRLAWIVAAELLLKLPLALAFDRIDGPRLHPHPHDLAGATVAYALTGAKSMGQALLSAFIEALSVGLQIQVLVDALAHRARSFRSQISDSAAIYLPMVGVMALQNGVGSLGFLLFFVPGLVSFAILAIAPAAVSAGRVRFGQALRQSWEAGMAKFWPLLALGTVMVALVVLGEIAARWLGPSMVARPAAQAALEGIVRRTVAAMLVVPYVAVVTVFYVRAYGERRDEA